MFFVYEVILDLVWELLRPDKRRVRDVERKSWSVRRSRRRLELDQELRRRLAIKNQQSVTLDQEAD